MTVLASALPAGDLVMNFSLMLLLRDLSSLLQNIFPLISASSPALKAAARSTYLRKLALGACQQTIQVQRTWIKVLSSGLGPLWWILCSSLWANTRQKVSGGGLVPAIP